MGFRKKIEGKRWFTVHVCFSSDTSRSVDVEVWLRLRPPM
jgi:hypothetical protein